MKLPTVLESERIHNNFLKIRRDILEVDGQDDYTYYTLEVKPFAVMVIAKAADGRYLVNREYRHPTGHVILGAPGGTMDGDESFLECAKRELLEETGYTAKSFTLLGESYPFPGVCLQSTVFVLATDIEKVAKPNLDHAELIEAELFTKDELHAAMKKSKVDGILLAGLYLEGL
ncbi:MAG: hypothetical protein S4CHLAM81_09620 [Chlamydiales bacterium]|nr:hypothetical protein [Chlamydiales bacterium]MCH9635740.1 hypothetical protein [Chlamydiales bacterium]MCH9703508.1 NUDIX hydrolase [Chlamydiota bacterium]